MIYYNYDVTLDLCKVFIHLDVYNKYKRRYMKDIKSNAIYRIRRCKIRKFFYVTFHFDTITMLHSAFAKYTFFHLNNTNNYKQKNIYKKFGIYKFWYFRIEGNFTLRNLDTISLYKIYIISLVIIINDEKKYIKIYIDWKVGMKNSVRGFDWRNGTRVPPSDVPNFQKKVRALSCYTVVPLCRKQSIKEVSLY